MSSWQLYQFKKRAYKELQEAIKTSSNMLTYPDSYITEDDMENWRDWIWKLMFIIGDNIDITYSKRFRLFEKKIINTTNKEEIRKTIFFLKNICQEIKDSLLQDD